jgi:uncharacterized protein (DUF1697 family)
VAIYVSMLRGINVGGHKQIKMDQLRKSFEELGFEQVKTYIQSGNVVFKTGKVSTSALSKRIEEKILDDFGFLASVVSRTSDEMRKTIENNPFLKEGGANAEKLHVTFMSEAPTAAALKKLTELMVEPDQLRYSGKELFFNLPNGVSESVLMKKPVDRVLGVVITTRNWKTVNSLHQMCGDCR